MRCNALFHKVLPVLTKYFNTIFFCPIRHERIQIKKKHTLPRMKSFKPNTIKLIRMNNNNFIRVSITSTNHHLLKMG